MIYDRLRALRKESGLSVEDVSKKLKIAKSTIYGYENGGSEPGTKEICALAKFYGVSTDYLLCEECTEQRPSYIKPNTLRIIEDKLNEIGFSTIDFAKQLQIDKQYARDILTGNKFPDLKTLKEIASEFEIPLDTLINRDAVADENKRILDFTINPENIEYIKVVEFAKAKGISAKRLRFLVDALINEQ